MKRAAFVCCSLTLLFVEASGLARPAEVQAQRLTRLCLHGDDETAAERTRRTEALATMRMIDDVLQTFPVLRMPSPGWDEVAQSGALSRLQSDTGTIGTLARRVRWGTDEPLPGWGIAFVTGRGESKYALTDMRDPCAFTYSSADPDVVRSGRRGLLVPLTD